MKKTRSLIAALLLCSLLVMMSSGCDPAPTTTVETTAEVREWIDVAYANQSDAQKLDIFLPTTGDGPFPVIISIHGGGFLGGDKGGVSQILSGLEHGYAIVRINYRFSSEAIFPAALFDAKAAVRFIKANADKYRLDASKVAVQGESAGGNLAAMLGTSGGVADLEDLTMGNADQTSTVQAVIDQFGPINFLTMDAENEASGINDLLPLPAVQHNPATSPSSKYFGAPVQEVPEIAERNNATNYITPDDPPFLIMHGTMDNMIPTAQSVNFAAALKAVIGEDKVQLILLEGAGHGTKEFGQPENVDVMFTFLDQYFKAN